MTATSTPVVPAWTLADRIAKARQHAGLDQHELGRRLGVSGSLVSMWERGAREPKLSQVHQIAAATGVDARWLGFGASGWMTRSKAERPLPLAA